MKIDKIDVQTSNYKHKTDISLLVDKRAFLEDIQQLREKWQLKEPQKSKVSYGMVHMVSDDSLLSYSKMDVNEAKKKLPEFKLDIDNLLKKFKRGKNFRLIVLFALFQSSIPEGIYESCYFDVVTLNEPEDMNKPENYQYVIVLSPRTELHEVKKAFAEFVEYRKRKIKFHQPRIPIGGPATKEITEALERIDKEKKICDEKISKNKNNPEEVNKAIGAFLENTAEAREYMLQIGELHMDIPEHRALIEQFHPGNIYTTADAAKFRGKPDIDRIREWYWIKNQDYFNGDSLQPLKYPEVLDAWLNTCPFYKDSKTHDMNGPECPKCTFETKRIRTDKRVKEGGGSYNHIEKALDTYEELLLNS